MRMWDHLWAGVLVSLVMGVVLIGGGAYYWAWQEQGKRERERQWNEGVTGVKVPPPTPEQAGKDWQRDLITGATVGGGIWLLGVVTVFWRAWKDRGRPVPVSRFPANDEHPTEPGAADVTEGVKPPSQ
jgi:hypothetical protein